MSSETKLENKGKSYKIKVCSELAGKIYDLRKKAKLTQKDLAEKLQIKQPTYARMEGGQNMTITNIHKVAEACGCKVDIVFTPKQTVVEATTQ